jgi:hypothetical protein
VGWGRPDGLTCRYLWPGDQPAKAPLLLPARSCLADFAAERVVASRLATRRVALAANCEATISAVRIPGEDGVAWSVWFGPGQDATDPAISRAADSRCLRCGSSSAAEPRSTAPAPDAAGWASWRAAGEWHW